MDGMCSDMEHPHDRQHESFPKIGQSLSLSHGSPETEQNDAHTYISMTPHPMHMSAVD